MLRCSRRTESTRMERTAPQTSQDRLLLISVAVAWLLAIAAVNVVRYLPTHDGPQHVYLGHVINRFSDAGAISPQYFRPTQPLSALGFSLLFCPFEDLFGWKVALRISLSIIVTIWGWGFWTLARALSPQRALVDTQAGCSRALDRWYPYFEPTLNVGTLFAIEQGGVVPYTFTSVPQLHGLVLTEEGLARMPPAPHRQVFGAALLVATRNGDRDKVFATLTNIASFGARYEDVILHAVNDEQEVFTSRGYRLDASYGKTRFLRLEGGPVRVAVPAPGALPHSIVLEYGWRPVTRHSFLMEAPAGAQPQDGEIAFVLEKAPCGWIWLRAWSDQDNSGILSPADRVCAGADEDGRLRAKLGPGVGACCACLRSVLRDPCESQENHG